MFFVYEQVLMSFKKMVSPNVPNTDLRNFPRNPPENFYKELYEFYQYLKKENIEEKPIILCTDELQVSESRAIPYLNIKVVKDQKYVNTSDVDLHLNVIKSSSDIFIISWCVVCVGVCVWVVCVWGATYLNL